MIRFIGRMMIAGWFGSMILSLSAIAAGQRTPSAVLMRWSDSARPGDELVSLVDLRSGHTVAVSLPPVMPLAQQAIVAGCGAQYHILRPDAPTTLYLNVAFPNQFRPREAALPQQSDAGTARIGRRSLSPDGRWLFLPFDHLGLVVDQITGQAFTLFPSAEPISAGQPGYWSPDSRWLLWPAELEGERVQWLTFDSRAGSVTRIETMGQQTRIDDVRWGVWSPDAQTFATIQRGVDAAGDSRADVLLLAPSAQTVRSYGFVALANELVWSPGSDTLVLYASQQPGERLVPSLLDVGSGTIRHLAEDGYPAPALMRPASYTPTWSDDGRLLSLFTSAAPSQSAIITLHILTTDGAIHLTAPLPSRARIPANAQFWSADGGQFALHDTSLGTLHVYDLVAGTTTMIGQSMGTISAVVPAANDLIFIADTRPGSAIYRYRWAAGTTELLRRLDGTSSAFSLCEPEP